MLRNNTRGRRPMVRLVFALTASSLLVPSPASAGRAGDGPPETAAADGGFAVQPSGPDGPGSRDWFTYTLDPGEVFGDVVAVSNLGDEPKTFHIYATDAASVADVGGFTAIRDDEKAVDVGTWIELGVEEYTVDPGKRVDVPFRVTVPEDAEPGDHAGAILAIDTADLDPDDEDGISLDVVQRLGARVYV